MPAADRSGGVLGAARAFGLAAGALVVLLLMAVSFGPGRVSAHGKEVDVRLSCAPADPQVPLAQSCEAVVTFASDGDPVKDAHLALRAVRVDRGEEVRASVQPSAQPGHYVGVLVLPAYGLWQISVEVSAPAEGHVELVRQVLPPAAQSGLPSQARAQLLIRFRGRDVANIIALILHLAGALLLLAAPGVVIVGGLLVSSSEAGAFWGRMRTAFPVASVGAFALIALSGLYNAAYNAPTRAPGLFTPSVIAGLPYGRAYLVAFAMKNLLAVALAIGTFRLALMIRRAPVATFDGGARPAHVDRRVRLGLVNLAIGGLLIITVIVVDYLHLLSHASVLLGS